MSSLRDFLYLLIIMSNATLLCETSGPRTTLRRPPAAAAEEAKVHSDGCTESCKRSGSQVIQKAKKVDRYFGSKHNSANKLAQ